MDEMDDLFKERKELNLSDASEKIECCWVWVHSANALKREYRAFDVVSHGQY